MYRKRSSSSNSWQPDRTALAQSEICTRLMKILVIHQYYLMPGQPGGSRFNEMARLWVEQGHEVTVIAGNVDYSSGKTPKHYRGRWLLKEQDGPVTVWRCHVPESYARSYSGRMWAFFVFIFSAVTAVLRAERPDIIVATSPPLIVVVPALLAARLRRTPIPWIFEVRDLWPETAITTGVLSRKSLLTSLLYALERWAYRFATRINVLTPAFREDILERGLATANKIAFIPNGADLDQFQPGPLDNEVRRQLGWGNRFVVLYAGAHGRANAVRQLVDAAECLRDRPDILIACVGDGTERESLEALARDRRLENIVFLGPQPKNRMPLFVNGASAGAAVLQNNPTFRTVYPNKVFDYMACRRPTLLAIDGVARRMVCEEAGAGVFAEPENGAAIASAIRFLANNPVLCAEMGERGREWVVANVGRRTLALRYLELMADLVPRPLAPDCTPSNLVDARQ
jgi:glycosyltransferase involved in cell wall biosynthesis